MAFAWHLFFHLGSHVIPTLKLIGVGGLLPRMIFHRLEPMFDYPEKWLFPIYIYTVSLFLGFFDVFWPFLPDFGFYRFFVWYPQENRCFLTFFAGSFPSLRYSHFLDSIFSVPFKEMGFIFYRFFIFLANFLSFNFFWIVWFFDRFLSFFINPFFSRFLSNVASVGRSFFL